MTGALLQHLPAPHKGGCEALCLDPCRQCVLTGGADYALRAWSWPTSPAANAEPSSEPASQVMQGRQTFAGHQGAVLDAVVAHGCVVSVGEGDAVHVWRLQGAGGRAAAGRQRPQHPDHNLLQRSWLLPTAEEGPGSGSLAVPSRAQAGGSAAAAASGLAALLDDPLRVAQWRAPSVDPGERLAQACTCCMCGAANSLNMPPLISLPSPVPLMAMQASSPCCQQPWHQRCCSSSRPASSHCPCRLVLSLRHACAAPLPRALQPAAVCTGCAALGCLHMLWTMQWCWRSWAAGSRPFLRTTCSP